MDSQFLKSNKIVLDDLLSGLVIFLVAVPLSLGVAQSTGLPPASGLLAGVIGGILVGMISGSHVSVSGPSPGLILVIVSQFAVLGSFEAVLTATIIAGILQVVAGCFHVGVFADFLPTALIRGVIAAFGVIFILKQIPHILGHDADPEGEMAFWQPDRETTFSELFSMGNDWHVGAAVVGLTCFLVLVALEYRKFSRKLPVPSPLIAIGVALLLSLGLSQFGAPWTIDGKHLFQVPLANDWGKIWNYLHAPDFSALLNPKVYLAGVLIATIGSLESLISIKAIDMIDEQGRRTSGNRELIAQGCGNMLCGLMGGLPITCLVPHSAVNIISNGRTKRATILHGCFFLLSVVFFPGLLNRIPLSCLAAILMFVSFQLARPDYFVRAWRAGPYQFAPFMITLLAILFTDLLPGILIGLGVSIAFILHSNLKRPLTRTIEKHIGGELFVIELANQVSFLNRAVLDHTLQTAPRGTSILIDATNSEYIDPDIINMIREFKDVTAAKHGVTVSLKGFREKYQIEDEINFVDYSTRELQSQLTPAQVLQLLEEGNSRFLSGKRLSRDLGRQITATSAGQHPLAIVLSCIDSRTPTELILDLGLGDIFNIRVAGNVVGPKVLASIEYGTAVAGAKLIVVMGHTRCGAINASVQLLESPDIAAATGCEHLDAIVDRVRECIDAREWEAHKDETGEPKQAYADKVARMNVIRHVDMIVQNSKTVQRLLQDGKVAVVGAMYDITTGKMEFLKEAQRGLSPSDKGEVAVS